MSEIELVVSVPEIPLWVLIVAGSLPYLLIGMWWGRRACHRIIEGDNLNKYMAWDNGVIVGFLLLFFWPVWIVLRILSLPFILIYKGLTYGLLDMWESK